MLPSNVKVLPRRYLFIFSYFSRNKIFPERAVSYVVMLIELFIKRVNGR